jgi:NADPH-dependent 2,4-dienoyl-CoA reductase/sulfur reductase-like enzyme
MTQPFHKVIMVAAGPVGLLLALMMAKRGIEVVVLEAD